MQKLYHFSCPKCNNNHSFYRYGKDVKNVSNGQLSILSRAWKA